jgi:hypothetical protein
MRVFVWLLLVAATSARAEHAHRFTWHQKPTDAQLQACLAEMRQVVETAGSLVAGPDGRGDPIIDPLRLQFNGRHPAARQAFFFPGNEGPNSCATGRAPYGAVVAACLLVAHDHFPAHILEIDSDGQWGEGDWAEGAALYRKALGQRPHNPLPVVEEWPAPAPAKAPPDYRLPFMIIIGVVLLLVMIMARPRPLFVIQIRDGMARPTRGLPPQGFLASVNDVCIQDHVSSGTIRGFPARKRIALTFSGGIPAQCRQRLRNLWGLRP